MKKISHKLILIMSIMTLVSVTVLWMYQIGFLEENYRKMRLDYLKNSVEGLGHSYRLGNMEEVERSIEELLYTNNIDMEISSYSNISRSHMGHGMGHMLNQRILRGEYLEELIENKRVSSITSYSRLNIQVFTYSILLDDLDTIITGSMPLEPINDTIDILKKQMTTISIILFSLALIISVIISKIFLSPIKKLDQAVKLLSQGDLTARVDIASKDEIGDLAENFNKMGEKLYRIDKFRKDLVSNVSHELRTPLGIIKGYAELSRDIHINNQEKLRGNLEIIIEESDRLSEFVDDNLMISQIEAGYIPLEKKDFDIVKLAENIIEKHKIRGLEKEINIYLNSDSGSFLVNGDEKKIGQVFHNLLSNSINYTERNGQIDINIYRKGEKVKVEVVDNGIGIDEGELKNIWDRYYKVDHNSSGKKGTGLGLPIVKSILEAHKLNYGVESKLGKGSKFYFEI